MKTGISITVFVILLAAAAGTSAEDIRKVEAVEFRGLDCLSGHSLIREVRKKALKKGMLIDVDSLDDVLSRNSFVRGYRFFLKGSRLVIEIEEKDPLLVYAVVREGKASLMELDDSMEVISGNGPQCGDRPYIIISDSDLKDRGLKLKAQRIAAILKSLKEGKNPLYREISEIYFEGNSLRVILRGRRTLFTLRADFSQFKKLGYLAGYFDRTGYYPARVNVSAGIIVVR